MFLLSICKFLKWLNPFTEENPDLPNYSVLLNKSDTNDAFDEKDLLSHIPEKRRPDAKTLLDFFNTYPEQVTWNHSGVLFIDQTAIPNSNIHEIFKILYGSQTSKTISNVNGLGELLEKIKQMRLTHLVPVPKSKYLLKDISSDDSSDEMPWYYLG